jgi:hypothetical protein
MQIRALPIVKPGDDLPHRPLDQRRRKPAVIGQRQALLLDAGLGEGGLDLLAFTGLVLAVLREIEDALHP